MILTSAGSRSSVSRENMEQSKSASHARRQLDIFCQSTKDLCFSAWKSISHKYRRNDIRNFAWGRRSVTNEFSFKKKVLEQGCEKIKAAEV